MLREKAEETKNKYYFSKTEQKRSKNTVFKKS